MLDCEEGPANVGVVGLLPEVERELPDGVGVGLVGYAGVGDEDVEGPEVGSGLGDAGLDGFF